MKPLALSTCLCTRSLDAFRDFSVNILEGVITFDCGWYVNIRLGGSGAEVQFMEPQSPDMPVTNGEGIILNLRVEDVDSVHAALAAKGQTITTPLEDHPWGAGDSALQPPWAFRSTFTRKSSLAGSSSSITGNDERRAAQPGRRTRKPASPGSPPAWTAFYCAGSAGCALTSWPPIWRETTPINAKSRPTLSS